MSRLIFVLLVVAALLAVVTLALAALGGNSDRDRTLPVTQRRSSMLQKVSYGFLLAVMFGVGSGMMGVE